MKSSDCANCARYAHYANRANHAKSILSDGYNERSTLHKGLLLLALIVVSALTALILSYLLHQLPEQEVFDEYSSLQTNQWAFVRGEPRPEIAQSAQKSKESPHAVNSLALLSDLKMHNAMRFTNAQVALKRDNEKPSHAHSANHHSTNHHSINHHSTNQQSYNQHRKCASGTKCEQDKDIASTVRHWEAAFLARNL
ncbi:hypothetical protein ACFO4O_05625 [Glaciecola siphonariae]|uniref:Uncharacterized protein n=1 Tax=Glaciecola siphonariae TaxID=521012 RepID=A0ABV9LTY8_9ALTE